MRTVECTIEIARPPEALFDFMLAADTGPEWRDFVSKMEWLEPPAVGARARLSAWVGGRNLEQIVTLVACERPHHFTFENHNAGYLLRSDNRIDVTPTGARLTLTVDVTGDSIWESMLMFLVRSRHRSRFPRTLARLKAAAEKPR